MNRIQGIIENLSMHFRSEQGNKQGKKKDRIAPVLFYFQQYTVRVRINLEPKPGYLR